MTRHRFKGFGGGYYRADPGLPQGSALSAVMMILDLSRLRHRHLAIAGLCTESQIPHDQFVLFLREFVHRTIRRFPGDSINDGLLELRSYLGIPKGLHHASQRVHEVFHEVVDATGATAHMPLQTLAHHAPAKSRSIANGCVSFLDTQHALLDEVEHLAV